MNPLCHYREFAIQRLQLQHKVERQGQTYLQVFAHKATDERVKQAILSACENTHDRLNSLESLLFSMNEVTQPGYPEATNGIIYEGLQRLEGELDPFTRDGIILQTLIMLYEYKLGSYRITALYFQALEQEYALYVTQSLLNNEGETLQKFSNLLTADMMNSSTKVQSPTQPIGHRIRRKVISNELFSRY